MMRNYITAFKYNLYIFLAPIKWRAVEIVTNVCRHLPRSRNKAVLGVGNNGRSIIVFDYKLPTPDQDAGSVRMEALLDILKQWGHVVFVPLTSKTSVHYEEALESQGVEIVYLSQVKRHLRDRKFAIAILSRAIVADVTLKMIRRVSPSTRIIFDTVDLHFLRTEREFGITKKASTGTLAVFLKKQETRLAGKCDQVWCVTEADKAALAEATEAEIAIVPTIHKLEERHLKFENRTGLLFIGGFAHSPNVDAVHYFLREIFPLVQQSIPGVRIHIIGSAMPPDILAYHSDSVNVLGYVADVDVYFERARVFVAPLRYGAGMKGKIGQALSFGLPVVSTTIGIEGMNMTNGDECLIADDPVHFAECVTRAYLDAGLWQKLSDAGYQHVQENYTPEIVCRHVHLLLDNLVSTPVKVQ